MSLFPARLPLFSPGELRVGAQAGVWKLAHTVCEIRCPNRLFVGDFCRLTKKYAVESWRVEIGERAVFNRRAPSSMAQAKVGADRGAQTAVLTG
jgi:hypothetical protein